MSLSLTGSTGSWSRWGRGQETVPEAPVLAVVPELGPPGMLQSLCLVLVLTGRPFSTGTRSSVALWDSVGPPHQVGEQRSNISRAQRAAPPPRTKCQGLIRVCSHEALASCPTPVSPLLLRRWPLLCAAPRPPGARAAAPLGGDRAGMYRHIFAPTHPERAFLRPPVCRTPLSLGLLYPSAHWASLPGGDWFTPVFCLPPHGTPLSASVGLLPCRVLRTQHSAGTVCRGCE